MGGEVRVQVAGLLQETGDHDQRPDSRPEHRGSAGRHHRCRAQEQLAHRECRHPLAWH